MTIKSRYTQDFKARAVKLAKRLISRLLELNKSLEKPTLLYSWLKKEGQPQEVKAVMQHLSQQEAEIKQLNQRCTLTLANFFA